MINGRHYMTIATDASVAHGKIGSAFGYYIRTDEHYIKHAWYKHERKSPQIAEITCLAHAIDHLLSLYNYDIPANTTLILNIDSDYCSYLVNHDNVRLRFCLRNAISIALIEMLLSYFDEVDIRVMKSHQMTGTKKNYMNRWCDINARAQLKSKGQAELIRIK